MVAFHDAGGVEVLAGVGVIEAEHDLGAGSSWVAVFDISDGSLLDGYGELDADLWVGIELGDDGDLTHLLGSQLAIRGDGRIGGVCAKLKAPRAVDAAVDLVLGDIVRLDRTGPRDSAIVDGDGLLERLVSRLHANGRVSRLESSHKSAAGNRRNGGVA